MRDALREFGWVEGKTILFEVRQAEGNPERLPDLAVDLVRSRVDVIMAVAPSAIRAAKRATTTIPIVMSWWGGPDLVESGIIASLARPGANVTGVHMLLYALDGKRLELLHDAVPSARKIAVLIHDRTRMEPQLPAVMDIVRKRGLEMQVVDTAEFEGYERACDVIVKARARALLVMSSPIANRDRKLIVEAAARRRVPAIYDWGDTARDGGLIAYGATFAELFRLSASSVDNILKGARPGELPVEQPWSSTQDREGPRPHRSAVAAAAGGSGDCMMDRRAFVVGGVAAVVTPLAAVAQQPGRIARVGVLPL